MRKQSLDILSAEVEIPDVVQKKAQEAFAQIHLERKEDNVKRMMKDKRKQTHGFGKTKAAAAALAVLVGGGSITALGAAYMHWSHGMQTQMNVSEEQMIELQKAEKTPVSFPTVSDTRGDITVSVAQCLVDENDIRVALYINGYELESNAKPKLDNLTILLDGQNVGNCEWDFYTGIDWDKEGNPVMADGSEVQKNANGEIVPNYRTAEGKLELDLRLSPVNENGNAVTSLAGKDIRIQLNNLGETTETWNLEWTLESTSTAVKAKVNEVLGNSGATVTSVEVAPMSIKIYYDFPRTEIQKTALDENGNAKAYTELAEPPRFAGIKMADGTVYSGSFGGGTYGYESTNSSVYVAKVSLLRIVNPKEVQSLLFFRDDIAITGENEMTEADCYEVKIK